MSPGDRYLYPLLNMYVLYLDAFALILERAGQTSIQNKLALFEEQLASIRSTTTEEEKDVESIGSILLDLYTQLEQLDNGNSEIAAIPTGFYDLDTILGGGLHRQELVILAGRPSMGKCLGKGTRVIMYDGTLKKVEDIRIGDLLMGVDSTPRQVLNLVRGTEQMYWIRQNRGIDYRVNASHVLSLQRSRNQYKYRRGDVLNISVTDYLSKSNKFRSNYKGYKVAIDFLQKPVPIDPYFLGLWLGDGSASGSRITNPEPEIEDFIYKYAQQINHKVTLSENASSCLTYGIVSISRKQSTLHHCLHTVMRQMDLLNNKHIPHIYIANSEDCRLKLLAGLLDTDGYYCSRFNCFEITQKSLALSQQIKYLCDTLGFSTSLKSKKAVIKERRFECEVYRVRISGDLSRIPTLVERKKARPLRTYRDWRRTGIRIEPDKIDEYYGFTLDGDHLFMLEDGTVTHNSAAAHQIAYSIAKQQNAPTLLFSLEMSKKQVVGRIAAAQSAIPANCFRTGIMGTAQWQTLAMQMLDMELVPFYISDYFSNSVLSIGAKIKQAIAQYGQISLVVVDYLQLMSGGENEVRELGEITRRFKILARECNVPIILLSQLSRGVESRADKRPMMSDLRSSGAIEQDADVVIMLYRDEYYNPDSSDRGIAEMNVVKQRNGPTGTVKLLFDAQYTKFKNLVRRD
jgi:replicative DNA helicase